MEESPIKKELNHTEEHPVQDERSHRRAKRSSGSTVHRFTLHCAALFLLKGNAQEDECAPNITRFCLFCPGNVEMEIDNLYKAVPQLHKVFNVIDKIGEGMFPQYH